MTRPQTPDRPHPHSPARGLATPMVAGGVAGVLLAGAGMGGLLGPVALAAGLLALSGGALALAGLMRRAAPITHATPAAPVVPASPAPDPLEFLLPVADAVGIGVVVTEADGTIRAVGGPVAEWLGRDAAALAGAPLHSLLGDAPREGERPPDRLKRPGDDPGADILLPTPAGPSRFRLVEGPLPSPHRGRSIALLRPAGEMGELRSELAREQHRFARFFEFAPIGIALVDPQLKLIDCNPTFQSFAALPLAELRNRSVGLLAARDQRADLTRRLRAALAGEDGPDQPLEVRFGGPGGPIVSIYARRVDQENEGGEPGLILHVVDMTGQKNLEAQFAQSQKMQAVGQLAGGVAHDFNNLLTAMIGFCDLLLLRHKPGDHSFTDIMQIKQNANRAANLVRQLLAFSRQQTLQPRVLNITDVLAELSNLLRRLIGEHIELRMIHGRDLGLVKVDQGQLEQVIINLAVNARDAMAGGGRLTITTANFSTDRPVTRQTEVMPPGDYVVVEVADTGCGIPKENLQRIFEPFFSTKEVGSGTGLGLSTVYGIVRQTGGFVVVDSAPGEGATFSIYLPRHQETAATSAQPEAKEERGPADLTGMGTILLVEDEDAVRVFGARALRNKGYHVLEARSAEAALELLHKDGMQIDLIITDVVMPQMDGPTLIREVRKFRPGMKVIFISGYTEDRFRSAVDEGEKLEFLPKPFSLKQLASKVKEVIAG